MKNGLTRLEQALIALTGVDEARRRSACRDLAGLVVEMLDMKGNEMRSKYQLALDVLSRDAHRFTCRPCSTCNTISSLIGESFGCVIEQKDHTERMKSEAVTLAAVKTPQ